MSELVCHLKGEIAFVKISNPGKLNALDVAMWTALRSEFEALSKSKQLRCVVLSGAEGNFAAGADIAEFATVRNSLGSGMHYHQNIIALALKAISTCIHPVIAAIEGVCVGGGLEIACACDIRIAAPTARFGIPISRLGFPLAPFELQGLLELIGKAATLEILLEGRIFDAHEAKDKGLIQRIAEDAPKEALATALRIARGAPLAVRMNKQLVRRCNATAEPLNAEELKAAFSFLESSDYQEGISSFMQKRPPQFTGT